MNKSDLSVHLSDAFKEPVRLEQFANSIPEATKVLVRESATQFTRNDTLRTISRRTRVGIHYLNPPLTDGLNSVGALYKAISNAAWNYQLEHVTSYFEMFPRLTDAILSDTEKAQLTTQWLRLHYKELSSRVAHRIWHYCQVTTLQSAALINMLNLGRFEGSEVTFKTVASIFRASRINTMTPNYSKFPRVKGVEDYLMSNGVYLAGQANDGTPLISIPLYATDVFGNRGWHTIVPSNFVSLDNNDMLFQDEEAVPYDSAEPMTKLARNVAATILQYGTVRSDGSLYDMRMPQVENGGMLYASAPGVCDASARTQGGPESESFYKRWGDDSAFCDAILNNYGNWTDYLQRFFADFADVTSDWYRLVTDTLGICEEAKTVSGMMTVIRGLKFGTIESYLSQATFGKSGKATCATTIKYAPYYFSETVIPGDSDFIERNLNRYKFYLDDVRTVIRESLVYPKLTPTIFLSDKGERATDAIYAMNTGPNYLPSDNSGSASEKYDGTSPLVYGQRAAYDLLRAVSVDLEEDQIVTIGITQDASQRRADSDTTSKVYNELRSALFVDVLPLIDDTDPYVCGLHLFFAEDSALKSQTELTLLDANNGRSPAGFSVASTALLARDVIVKTIEVPQVGAAGQIKDLPLAESYPSVADSAEFQLPAHVCNPAYYSRLKHAHAFLGVSMMSDIVNGALLQNAGSEFKLYNGGSLVGRAWRAVFTDDLNSGSSKRTVGVSMLQKMKPRYSIDVRPDNSYLAVFAMAVGLPRTIVQNVADYAFAEITMPCTYGINAICAEANPLRSDRAPTHIIGSKVTAGSNNKIDRVRLMQINYQSSAEKPDNSTPIQFINGDNLSESLERSVYGLSHTRATIVDTRGFVDELSFIRTSPVFSLMCDAKLRLMGTTFVKATGKRNHVPFWDEDRPMYRQLEENRLSGSIDFVRNDYVAEVRVSQKTHEARGINGTTSKQGDSPRFIKPNRVKRSHGKGKNRRYGNRNDRDGSVSTDIPEKESRQPMKRGNHDRGVVHEDKPFLDSMSGASNREQRSSVTAADRKVNKPGEAAENAVTMV